MIGLDTNVVVRYLTQDDRTQTKAANTLIESELNESNPGYITLITLIEITWVLESCYDQTREDLSRAIQSLLSVKQLLLERADMAYLALKRYNKGNTDFSDALIAVISEDAGCGKLVTLDEKAVNIRVEKL